MERPTVTIAEVARLEQVTPRQIQRYCRAPGFKGHVLPATRKGRGFAIEESAYRAWRLECQFDFLPSPDENAGRSSAAVSASIATPQKAGGFPPGSPDEEPGPISPAPSFSELRRRYFAPDRVGGPITNVHAIGSGSMCSPESCRLYLEASARRLKAKLRGYDDDDE